MTRIDWEISAKKSYLLRWSLMDPNRNKKKSGKVMTIYPPLKVHEGDLQHLLK